MNKLFLDFETYYDDEYSLRKMTPIEYILDPRFEPLGCAFAIDGVDAPAWWVDGPDLPATFAKIDWDDTFATSHNSPFDMLILALRYGVFPGFYGDTLAMARNWISHSTGSVALAAVAKFYGMGEKWGTLAKTKGVSFAAMKANPPLHEEVKLYGIDDAIKCRNIFRAIMDSGFPAMSQLEIIDWCVRMVTRPAFELDMNVLAEHLGEVQAKKKELLDNAFLDKPDSLMSDQQLAAKFLFLGVEPPMKTSKATGKQQYAFAKTDKAFTAMLEHDDPFIQALVAARLGHKSTIEETRTERLLAIGRMTKVLPVPLKYSGAHTHRFSGDWKINLQNLQRGGKLRRSLKAPKGKVVVSVDASQIEARLNAVLSGQDDLVEQFRKGEDVYASFAEDIYHMPINKRQHPTQRFVGKTGILSLGYGSSAPVFQAMCRNQGNVILTDHEAATIVYLYRAKYAKIAQNWKYANDTIIPAMSSASAAVHLGLSHGGLDWGPVIASKAHLQLPSGNKIHYRDLRNEYSTNPNTGVGKFQWIYNRGNMIHKIYGAKLVENVCQALAFIHIAEVAMKVKHMTEGQLIPAHQVHDELLYVVDEGIAEPVRDLVVREMSKSPVWMSNAPLAAEGHIGVTYGDTK